MILLEKFENGTDLNLYSANASFSGYGHYKVEIELEYRGEYQKFTKTTTDMEAIDEAKELGVESWEDSKMRLYECVQHQIEDQVNDWMQDVDWEIENEDE
ncbi:hypothetical protein QP519_10740 [Weeksella virosa]|uniref:hypothetical protein n=1 Tax=Weeksella virosa TaxID=1014 RepID=UPI0025564BA0|nr:hypothetical protein [Weeksella virosa]MDK7376011.1 hypothetical protein [Weeksella virosa]